jgi:hypothetical protein
MVCDEFLMACDKFGVLFDAELMVCDKFGVLFDAGGGFCFEMRHHDHRILHFFPRGFQASYAFFMIVPLAVAMGFSHVLRLAHDAASYTNSPARQIMLPVTMVAKGPPLNLRPLNGVLRLFDGDLLTS